MTAVFVTPGRLRFAVVFTPVGWQVVDSIDAGDPIAEFGTGADEYGRAAKKRDSLNLRSLKNTLDYHSLIESDRERLVAMRRKIAESSQSEPSACAR